MGSMYTLNDPPTALRTSAGSTNATTKGQASVMVQWRNNLNPTDRRRFMSGHSTRRRNAVILELRSVIVAVDSTITTKRGTVIVIQRDECRSLPY
jgi:hypothetical protein